ncbi:hypothetical protein IEQ34_013680 [Dendrobium chrysotoxum]|uniref:Uncharacterized protein n=1 Tax=Dendrobium chrysotoxum TaxID=161865 RepID=A0AAV7GQ37_DENCH|nr:hypothetical protein IEQ34_013680 [Dendrobium chrysotoxum]
MDRVSERDRSSRKTREERERDRDADSSFRDREFERDRKKHRHHHSGEERRHERYGESERRHHSIDDSPPEYDIRRRDRSPDRLRDSVERRKRSRGDSPSDDDPRARDSVERDREGDRRHRRSSKEDLENGGERKHERSSNKIRRSVEREGFSYEESTERRHRKRKDNRDSDGEEIENNNGKRARVSDAEHRKSMRRVEDRNLDDVRVFSEDSKEARRGKTSKDRRKEEMMVTEDDVKRIRKEEQEMNGSSRHRRKSRDDTEQEEKIDGEEAKEIVRNDRRFKDEFKQEKQETSVVSKASVSSDKSQVESNTGHLANANGDRSNAFPPTSGSLAKAFAEEPLAVAPNVSKTSSNSHSIHTKVSSITATNENEGVSIIRSDEVTGKSSTDGTTSSVAGKSGSFSRDALAKAKKALQMQKELAEKLKKIPVLNKQPGAGSIDSLHKESWKPLDAASRHGASISSSLSASTPIQMMPSAPKIAVGSAPSENASIAGGDGTIPVLATAASYEAVKRAQELAAKMGFHQDPDFAPLINMFPGSSVTDAVLMPKSTKGPVLRLDAQGREIDEHGNVINKPKVTNLSTLKVNINKQKKEAFQILRPELDADTELNTHFDAGIGINKAKLVRPKRTSFQFVEEGRWSKQAEVMKIKNQFGEAQAKELKVKQSQLAKAKAEPDDNPNLIAVGERTFKEKKKDEVPEIEWWDKPFLPSGTYHDTSEDNLNLEKITIYVEHPRPVEPPAEPAPPPPQPLKLTKKEQKKLRTQRRLAKERDRQEMIRQGLIEPPKPKIKMSNLMKVLSSEATQDPTKMEKEVKAAALEREQAHIDRNIARKLTPQERREKKERKLFEDPSMLETLVSVYRIDDLSHPQTRFKVDVNAQENRLTGCSVISDGISVVVVEGVRKSIKRYGKLMLKRINWAAAVGDDENGDEDKDIRLNRCVLVWQGSTAKPSFNRFLVHQCRSEAAARKVFADAGVPHYWDLAVNFSDELS